MRATGSIAVLCALVAACACREARGPTALPTAGRSEPERVLLAYTAAFNRHSVADVLALMSDDVVITGIDDCRGIPCVGREAARTGYVEGVLNAKFLRRNVSWLVKGDRVIAHYAARPGGTLPRGAGHIRGTMIFTVRNGLITRIENSIDLDDPETIVIRSAFGDVVIALRAPGTEDLVARVLVEQMTKSTTTAIIVQLLDDAAPRRGVGAKLRQGTCATRDASARDLHFVGDVLEARVELTTDQLLATPYSIDLTRDGVSIACGDFPPISPVGD